MGRLVSRIEEDEGGEDGMDRGGEEGDDASLLEKYSSSRILRVLSTCTVRVGYKPRSRRRDFLLRGLFSLKINKNAAHSHLIKPWCLSGRVLDYPNNSDHTVTQKPIFMPPNRCQSKN